MDATKLYLPFGAKVRRRALPGEPADREVGRVMGGTLSGDRHFVAFGRGARRRMLLLPTDELEQVWKEGEGDGR
jgi:hypothetical protein